MEATDLEVTLEEIEAAAEGQELRKKYINIDNIGLL
jgi:hypothetical protein